MQPSGMPATLQSCAGSLADQTTRCQLLVGLQREMESSASFLGCGRAAEGERVEPNLLVVASGLVVGIDRDVGEEAIGVVGVHGLGGGKPERLGLPAQKRSRGAVSHRIYMTPPFGWYSGLDAGTASVQPASSFLTRLPS